MQTFWAFFLGIVQGLTEFLPVSSSGHLVLAQRLIPNFEQPGVLFDTFLHLGTLFAVFIYFRKKIFSMNFNYFKLLIIGTVPAGLFGFLLRDQLENTFEIGGIFLVIQFFVTSVLCYFTDKLIGKRKEISVWDALIIGIGQSVAILPAISRSGTTIFAGVKRGIDKIAAAEFSFILSIPAIIGANLLEIFSYREELLVLKYDYLIGSLSAMLVGYFSIFFTIKFLKEGNFKIFAVYTALVGLIALFV